MAHDVFVCYSSEDKTIANAACAKLESAGIRCWIAPRDPIAGIPYGRQLVDAITAARVVLLIFSGNANRSEHVLRELEVASDSGKIIVPFRIEDIAPSGDLRYYITRVHWLDAMSPPMEARLTELVTLMQRLLEMPLTPAPPVAAVAATSRKNYVPIAAAVIFLAAVAAAIGLYLSRTHSAPNRPVAVAKPTPAAKPAKTKAKVSPTHAPKIAALPTPRIVYMTAAPAAPAPPPALPTAKPVAKQMHGAAPRRTATPKSRSAIVAARPTSAPVTTPVAAARPPSELQYVLPQGRSISVTFEGGSVWRVGTTEYSTAGRTTIGGTAGTSLMSSNGRVWLFLPDMGATGTYAHQVCFSGTPGTCDPNRALPVVSEH